MSNKVNVNILFIIILTIFCTAPFGVYAHGDEDHEDQDQVVREDAQNEPSLNEENISRNEEITPQESEAPAPFSAFPNLHPLVVHFPIVLLIVAAVLAVVNTFFVKKDLAWVITGCSFFGAVGAYAAANWFHAHVGGDVPEYIHNVFEQHEHWAEWTFYLALAGFIVQAASQFVFKQARWAVALAAIVLLSSAYAVSRTGHLGGQLVHIEGVGPQGKFLEKESEEHHH